MEAERLCNGNVNIGGTAILRGLVLASGLQSSGLFRFSFVLCVRLAFLRELFYELADVYYFHAVHDKPLPVNTNSFR